MPIGLADYDDVIHRIYDAAVRPDRWQDTVSAIAGLFQAPRALLFTWAHTPQQGGFLFTHNISQSALEHWAAKSMHEDPFVRAARATGVMVEGHATIDEELVPLDQLLATPFYKELWEPMDIGRLVTGVVFDATDSRKLPTVLSLYRSLRDEPFLRADADLLRRVLAHLSRALGVMFHLRDKDLRVAASVAALDRLDGGVVLFDDACQVRFANRAAQLLFASGETVVVGGPDSLAPGRMSLARRLAFLERRFQAMVRQAVDPRVGDVPEHFSQALVLPEREGRPGCVVHAAPLAATHGFQTGSTGVSGVAFLYDLQRAALVHPDLLCALFGTTPAESLAALQVLQGGSIGEMALRLGVSPNTLKTQLKAAYAKSGTHRQADLLKLLLALASR